MEIDVIFKIAAVGIIVTIVCQILKKSDREDIATIVSLAGLIIVPVVSLITPKPNRQLVDAAFSCYDRKVLVRQRQALGERE